MRCGFIKTLFILLATTAVHISYGQISDKEVTRAIKSTDMEVVIQFLDEGNDIDGIYGKEKTTLLNYSIKIDSYCVFERLLELGANPSVISNGKTPIMYAVQNKEPLMLRQLIKYGADLDQPAKKGNTAVINAAKAGRLKCVQLLVENGADVEITNDAGMTALDYANISNYPTLAGYLVKIIEMRHYYNNLPFYFDGPHIEWQNDTLVRMFYMVYDTIRNFPLLKDDFFAVNSDTVTLDGFAGDTKQYTITRDRSNDPSIFENVSRVLAIGDIHGQYDAITTYLINNKVIDENHNWIWGDGHVVFSGDVFDRGNEVTECLWLIYQLDIQARKNGGRVHMLLGNHEVMIITNDTRYLNKKYEVFSNYFLRDYAGFFDVNSELGHWLRDRNVIIKINDVIYSHAGISPLVYEKGLSFDMINSILRDYLHDPVMPKPGSDTELVTNVYGPLWYRGYILEMDNVYLITQKEVDEILHYYKANLMVIAHTENKEITSLYNDKVIAIDVPIRNRDFIPEALLVEDGKYYRVAGVGTVQTLY
jgi:hypothetical protein